MSDQPVGENQLWDKEIEPRKNVFHIPFRQLFQFKDLLFLFVRRDFVAYYKQTVLGPLWFILQPMIRVLVYYVVFGKVAKIPTDGLPNILFYLGGLTFWEYFASNWKTISNTFTQNQAIFGKVYFPRIIVPISVILTNLIKLGIQMFLLLAVILIYYFQGLTIELQPELFLLPVFIVMIAGHSLGLGLIISALTTKYRDLKFVLDTIIQLLFYVTPVIYPLNFVPGEFSPLFNLNPMAPIIEAIRFGLFGKGVFSLFSLGISLGIMLLTIGIGVVVFNRTERNFMDTV